MKSYLEHEQEKEKEEQMEAQEPSLKLEVGKFYRDIMDCRVEIVGRYGLDGELIEQFVGKVTVPNEDGTIYQHLDIFDSNGDCDSSGDDIISLWNEPSQNTIVTSIRDLSENLRNRLLYGENSVAVSESSELKVEPIVSTKMIIEQYFSKEANDAIQEGMDKWLAQDRTFTLPTSASGMAQQLLTKMQAQQRGWTSAVPVKFINSNYDFSDKYEGKWIVSPDNCAQHEWETFQLFTSSYRKCTKCGKEEESK